MIYALDLLAGRGLVDTTRDYVPVLEQLVEVYRSKPDFEEWNHPPSLLSGETGILLALYRLAPSSEIADRIAELVAANVADSHLEFMWGSPGTMLAARAIDRPDLWRASADHLRNAWEDSVLGPRTSMEDKSSTSVRRTGLRAVSLRSHTSRVRS